MTNFDVERIVEFEIEQLHEQIGEGLPHEEQVDIYERLCDLYELRIQQLKDKIEKIEPYDDGYNIQPT